MKFKSILIIPLLVVSLTLPAQRFQFMNSDDVEGVLEGILSEFGLNVDDIKIIASNEVHNAAADVKDGQRYIYYNRQWMQGLGSDYGNDNYWMKMGVLAHEVGHHLKGHTIRKGDSNPKLELEADNWSGYALCRLGATETQALLAVSKSPVLGKGKYPDRKKRQDAVKSGFRTANCDILVNQPPPDATGTTSRNREITPAFIKELEGKFRFGNTPPSSRSWRPGNCTVWATESVVCQSVEVNNDCTRLKVTFKCVKSGSSYDCGGGRSNPIDEIKIGVLSASLSYQNGVVKVLNPKVSINHPVGETDCDNDVLGMYQGRFAEIFMN